MSQVQSSTSSSNISHALIVLEHLCEKKVDEFAGRTTDAIHEESDEEKESSSYIFDRFYTNRGSLTLMDIPNFDF